MSHTVQRGDYSVPQEFAEIVTRIDSVPVSGRARSKDEDDEDLYISIFIYAHLGWNDSGDPHTHMIELDFSQSRKPRSATQSDVDKALKRFRRCYCAEYCLDSELHDTKKPTRDLLMALEIRKAIAVANGIPLDGAPEHEDKIDRILGAAEASP